MYILKPFSILGGMMVSIKMKILNDQPNLIAGDYICLFVVFFVIVCHFLKRIF